MEQTKLEVKATEVTTTEVTTTREINIVVTKQGNYPKKAEYFKGITENSVIVKLTDKYKSSKLPTTGMSPEELYEVARHDLRLRPDRVLNASLVIVVCNCRVLEVYQPKKWYADIETGRLTFEGSLASFSIRQKYLNMELPELGNVRYPAVYNY